MRRKKIKYLKIFVLINIFLLLFNIISYFFLTGPGVFRTKADSITMTLQARYDAPQCSDGIDNDGDGYVDYPDDPGCSSAADDDESDHPTPTPPPSPTTPTAPSQGNYNPPSQLPIREQELPVWLNINTINDQYLSDLTIPYQFTGQILTFKGQTNVNDAVIFIQLNDQPQIIYTTWANYNGYWEWTTPYSLNLSGYEIYIWAINPASPEITAEIRLEFQIVEQLVPPPPIPPATTTPPIVPPITPPIEPPTQPPTIIIYPKIVPKEIYRTAKEYYNLSIKILNKDKQIFPKDKIAVQTDLIKLKPKEAQELEITYLIKDSQGKIILEEKRHLTLPEATRFTQYFDTYFNIKPGKYFIEARIERDNKIFIANDYFIVNEKPIVFSSYELTITQQKLAKALIVSGFTLLIILIIFALLLINEYLKSFKEKHISEKDLTKDDYLDLE